MIIVGFQKILKWRFVDADIVNWQARNECLQNRKHGCSSSANYQTQEIGWLKVYTTNIKEELDKIKLFN